MSKKIVILLSLLCLITSYSEAQQSPPRYTEFGVKGGGSLYRYTSNVGLAGDDVTGGLHLGLYAIKPLSDVTSLQFETSFMFRGYALRRDVIAQNPFNYFDFTALGNFAIGDVGTSLLIGGNGSFILTNFDARRQLDFALVGGLQQDFAEKFLVSARYLYGLRDLSNTVNQPAYFSREFQLSLGYYFTR